MKSLTQTEFFNLFSNKTGDVYALFQFPGSAIKVTYNYGCSFSTGHIFIYKNNRISTVLKKIHNIVYDDDPEFCSREISFDCAFDNSLYAGNRVSMILLDKVILDEDILNPNPRLFIRNIISLGDKPCKLYLNNRTILANIYEFDVQNSLPAFIFHAQSTPIYLSRIHDISIKNKTTMKFKCSIDDSLYAGHDVALEFLYKEKTTLQDIETAIVSF